DEYRGGRREEQPRETFLNGDVDMTQDQTQQKGTVAVPERAAQANLFDITGPIVINYSRSSFAGPPLFSYKDAELSLSFQGDEITRVESSIGELVTVTL